MIFLSDTPRWYYARDNIPEGDKTISRIYGVYRKGITNHSVVPEIQAMKQNIMEHFHVEQESINRLTLFGKFFAVAGLEPQFFDQLVKGLGLEDEEWVKDLENRESWPAIRVAFEERFREKKRKEWENIFDGTDACATPVLTQGELEASGHEVKPGVTLTGTPAFPIGKLGWDVETVQPGQGGEETLNEWLGCKKDRDFISAF